MSTDFEIENTFRNKFRLVFREIHTINCKIDMKHGFFCFEEHVYSVEELLRSEHHSKIFSITEKIGDDAIQWARNGQLSKEAEKIYFEYRDRIDNELDAVNCRIMNRNKTWWEGSKAALTSFARLIMSKLPTVISQFLIGGTKRVTKFLTYDD